ncbi:hypothetical protein D3C80_1247270 [compost metagenome]
MPVPDDDQRAIEPPGFADNRRYRIVLSQLAFALETQLPQPSQRLLHGSNGMALLVSGSRILLLLVQADRSGAIAQGKRTVDRQQHMQAMAARLTVLLRKLQQTVRGTGAIDGDQDGTEHARLHCGSFEPAIVGQGQAQIHGPACTV